MQRLVRYLGGAVRNSVFMLMLVLCCSSCLVYAAGVAISAYGSYGGYGPYDESPSEPPTFDLEKVVTGETPDDLDSEFAFDVTIGDKSETVIVESTADEPVSVPVEGGEFSIEEQVEDYDGYKVDTSYDVEQSAEKNVFVDGYWSSDEILDVTDAYSDFQISFEKDGGCLTVDLDTSDENAMDGNLPYWVFVEEEHGRFAERYDMRVLNPSLLIDNLPAGDYSISVGTERFRAGGYGSSHGQVNARTNLDGSLEVIRLNGHHGVTKYSVLDRDGNEVKIFSIGEDTENDTYIVDGLEPNTWYDVVSDDFMSQKFATVTSYLSYEAVPGDKIHVSHDYDTSVTVTNDYKDLTERGDVIIRKYVYGEHADRTDTFDFRLTLLRGDAPTSECDNRPEKYGLLFEDGVSTFRLSHGESAMATKIPVGVHYMLEEYDASSGDYTTTIDGEHGTISTTLSEAISISTRDRGSYHWVHEYYVEDCHGNLTLEGVSEIGNSATNLLVDDSVHYDESNIEKEPFFSPVGGDDPYEYDYMGGQYGLLSENGYGVSSDMNYVVVTKEGSQIIILQYVRKEPVKTNGSYHVRREYYFEKLDGTILREATVHVGLVEGLLIDDTIHYDANSVEKKPEWFYYTVDGVKHEYAYIGEAYGRDGKTGAESPDMSYVVATEDGSQVIILKYLRKEVPVEPEEPEVPVEVGSYKFVHEYYSEFEDGSRVLDGISEIGSSALDLAIDDFVVYTDEFVELQPVYQDAAYDYEDSLYGHVGANGYTDDDSMDGVVATKDGSQIIILQYVRFVESEVPEEPELYGSYKFVHEYYTNQLDGAVTFDGRTDVLSSDLDLILDDEIVYDVSDVDLLNTYAGKSYDYFESAYGLMNGSEYGVVPEMMGVVATEDGSQVIVLRYIRDEVPEIPEEPDVYGFYRYVHEYYFEDVDGNRTLEGVSEIRDSEELLVDDSVHYDASHITKEPVFDKFEYQYDTDAYGGMNGDGYAVNPDMSYVVATEGGSQVIVLQYVRREISEIPVEKGFYQFVHEYYSEDFDGNRTLDGVSALMQSSELVLDDEQHYTEDLIDRVLSFTVDGHVYEYTYENAVYGVVSGDSYQVDDGMSYVIATKEGSQVIVLRYVRKPVIPEEPAKYGSLVVTKKVVGEDNSDKSFEFTIVLDDASISGTYGDVVFEHGKAVFFLKDGESKTVDGLPAGIGYEVFETAVDGYTVTSKNEKGVVLADELIVVDFVNTYHVSDEPEKPEEPDVPEKPDDKDKLEKPEQPNKTPDKPEKPGVENPSEPDTEPSLKKVGKVKGNIQTSDRNTIATSGLVFLFAAVCMAGVLTKVYRKDM